MKKEAFGIKLGKHDQRLTQAESAFLGILWIDHEGADEKITADDLAIAYGTRMDVPFLGYGGTYDQYLAEWKRNVRHMQNHLLIEHNIPVYSQTGNQGGYWIGTEEEGEKFYDAFRKRGLTGLKKAARGKQAVLVDMVQQLSFQFDDLEDQSGIPIVTIDGRATPIAVVDAMIAKMMRSPERFREDLLKLGQKFGSVLLPKSQVAEIKATTRKLEELVQTIL
jgi:hypothetical protein